MKSVTRASYFENRRRSGFSLTTVAWTAQTHRRLSAVIRLKPDLPGHSASGEQEFAREFKLRLEQRDND
jgi:hypothetical protein